MSSKKPHAVMVAIPLQGHLNPAVNLAFNLAAKGFTITFVNAESKTQRIVVNSSLTSNSNASHCTDIFIEARVTGLDIRYELVTDGVPDTFDVLSCFEPIADLFDKYIPAHVERLLRRLVTEGGEDCISCLVADTFYVWSATVAETFRIPFVSFWTETATVFSLYYHVDLLVENGHFDSQENRRKTITYIPGIPSIEPSELVSYFQEHNISTPTHQSLLKAFKETRKAKFVLCNTIQELEPQCTITLQQYQPLLTIGPIMQNNLNNISSSLWPQSDCSEWLDKQPHSSVLYISFGSIFKPNKRDYEEILRGVLESNARFLLVTNKSQGVENFDELNELLKFNDEKGMSVTWCAQKEVLRHKAIGCFLTHCGWNSILESIWCEVPMLCFPLCSDQFTNRKLVVKDWKIGVDIGPINNVCRDEVCKVIDRLIGEVGIDVRNNVKEVKKVLESALSPIGSSTTNFDKFVEELLKVDLEKCC